MEEHRFELRDQEVTIRLMPGDIKLFLNAEEIPISHRSGQPPFRTPYLPYLDFDSLDKLAKWLVHHRFPGGDY